MLRHIESLEGRRLLTGETGVLPGDFNFDGKTNVDDYAIIDAGIAAYNSGVRPVGFNTHGDANLDGKVNVDDYSLIDNNLVSMADRTGPLDESLTGYEQKTGTWTITQPGTYEKFVLDDGHIIVNVSGVTIRDFAITNADDENAIKAGDSTYVLTVEDGSISGAGGNDIMQVGVKTTGTSYMRRLRISESVADGINIKNNALVEQCYIYNLRYFPYDPEHPPHADGIQGWPVTTTGGNVIRRNTINAIGGSAPLQGVEGGWTMERNILRPPPTANSYTVDATADSSQHFSYNLFGIRTVGTDIGTEGGGIEDFGTWVGNIRSDGTAVTGS